LADLQQAVGNRAVSRLIAQRSARPIVQRRVSPTDAASSGDPDKVSDVAVSDWAGASNSDRRRSIYALLSKSVMFPWNDSTVRAIVNSYDRASMEETDLAAIRAVVKRGSMSPFAVSGFAAVATELDQAVRVMARANISSNLHILEDLEKQFGVDRPQEGGASGIPSAMDKLKAAAERVADARHVQYQLRKVPVAVGVMAGSAGLLPSGQRIMFDPDHQPIERSEAFPGPQPGNVPYDQVKAAHDTVEAAIARTMSANPALYILGATVTLFPKYKANDDHLRWDQSALAGFTSLGPDKQKKELENAVRQKKADLLRVQGKIDDIDVGGLDAVGLRIQQSPRFDSPFRKWAAAAHLEEEKTSKERLATFLDFATAVLLVGATIGTAGGAAAAAALLGGAATAAGVVSAGVKVSNASDLGQASKANVRPEDQLTSPVRVSGAEIDAAISAAVAILSIASAVKLLGIFRRTSSVVLDIKNLRGLPAQDATRVVSQSIREVGVAQTLAESGMTIDELKVFLPSGSAELIALEEMAGLTKATATSRGVTFNGKPISPSFPNWTGWHGAPDSPDVIAARGSLGQRGTVTDLYEHMRGNPASDFMGTTHLPMGPGEGQGAAHWAGEGGYVYKISGVEAYDTGQVWEANQSALGPGINHTRGELEIAIRRGVPWEKVDGWHEVLVGRGDSVKLGPYVDKASWKPGSP
jgi:hypothetical protein